MALADTHYNPAVDPVTERRLGLSRAAQLLGSGDLEEFFVAGHLTEGLTFAASGTGTHAYVAGGKHRFSCGNGSVYADAPAAGLLGYATTPFYLRVRMALASAMLSSTQAVAGMWHAPTPAVIVMGCSGTGFHAGGSNTKFTLFHYNGAWAPLLTSTVSIDTAMHTFELFRLTASGALYFQVDSELAQSTSPSLAAGVPVNGTVTAVFNGGADSAELDVASYQIITVRA